MLKGTTGPRLDPSAEAVLSALGTGRCSIDRIAGRLGLRDRRSVLGVKRALGRLASEGRAEDCGGGVWLRPGTDEAPPPPRARATSQDLLRHGFPGGSGSHSLAMLVRNVERASDLDASALTTLIPPMIDAGFLRLEGPRRYSITDAGRALAPPTPAAPAPLRPEGRVLALIGEPMDRAAIAAALGVSKERARQIANALVREGLAVRRPVRRADGAVVVRYHAADRPAPAPLEEVLRERLPHGFAASRPLAAALDRHHSDVEEAFRSLEAAGWLTCSPPLPPGTCLRLCGNPGADPLPGTAPALPPATRAAYGLLAEGIVTEGALLEALHEPNGDRAGLAEAMRILVGSGHCRPKGDGAWVPTALGLQVAAALRP